MVTAIIRKGDDTLVLDFPRAITDLRVKLLSIGILTPPDAITLFDDDKHGIEVQIASDSEFGQHLCRLFCENNTLADVNTATWLVKHADESFASDLENDVIYDQYSHANELIEDIKKRTEEAGSVKKEFFFPLTAELDEGDGNMVEVDDRFVSGYTYAIRDLIAEFIKEREVGNLAAYYEGNEGLKNKLCSADWTVEEIRGVTYGKVNVRLKEEPTEEETTALKEWISVQNSDGAYDALEQHPIDSEDGMLCINLWRGGNDYFIKDRAELNEYIELQRELKMGGM